MQFTIAAGPRQRSHSWVRVPRDLRSYFTVSDLRLPFRCLLRLAGLQWRYCGSSRVELSIKVKVKVTLRLKAGQPLRLGVEPHLGFTTRYLLLFDGYGVVFVGRPL
jgi:hypothetical protein